MRARWLSLVVALSVVAPSLALANPKPSAWEKFDEEDGIAVFRRDVPGTDVVALRGEGVVNAPILRVASVLVDTSRATEWIDSLEETRIIRKISDTEYVKWDHIGTPFVLADRDFVFDVKLQLQPKRKRFVVKFHSVEDHAAPKTDYVRGRFIYGKYVLTSIDGGKKTKVLAEILADPKGSVAKWIVNLFQKSWPHETLTALRAQVAKPDIKIDPKLKRAMKQAGF